MIFYNFTVLKQYIISLQAHNSYSIIKVLLVLFYMKVSHEVRNIKD